jgi:hypothetical protein
MDTLETYHKSSVLFGPHCGEEIKQKVKDKLGVQSDILRDTYLPSRQNVEANYGLF